MRTGALSAPRFMRALAVLALVAATSAPASVYRVGPGHSYLTPGDVPWESLAAGDSVLIHWRSTPYHDKWVICRTGTWAAPIVVRGIAGAGGTLPVIDGAGAVTRAGLDFWNENRGVLKIGGANHPPDVMPAWIVIETLEFRAARPSNSFTGRSGLTSYANNAAAIYIEKGQHIVIRGCHLTDCSNGLFCASETSELLVESNAIEDNGNVGSIFEHNNYTEALGIVFQFNHFGPLRAGAGGNNLKDRSAGTVIRYNWIEGGNRQLDLVESDFAGLVGDPRYHATFVYGNVLVEPGDVGNSQIAHYGGDGDVTANYRKGTLYFHHNSVVSRRTGNTTLLRLSTSDESADIRDNIVWVTAAGNRLGLLDQAGTLVATRNWLKTGWVKSHSGAASVIDNGQVTGAAPGFVSAGGDEFELVAGSPCIDTAVALLPGAVPAHMPVLEYVKHQARRVRPDDGRRDLGAYELGSVVGVAGGERPGASGTMRLVVIPSPASRACEIRLAGIVRANARTADMLEIVDLQGRQVARLRPAGAERWIWNPEASLREGIYYARAAGLAQKIILLR